MFNCFISFFGWFFFAFDSSSPPFHLGIVSHVVLCSRYSPFGIVALLVVQSTSINFIHIFKVHVAAVNFLYSHEMSVSFCDGTMGWNSECFLFIATSLLVFERFYSLVCGNFNNKQQINNHDWPWCNIIAHTEKGKVEKKGSNQNELHELSFELIQRTNKQIVFMYDNLKCCNRYWISQTDNKTLSVCFLLWWVHIIY